MNDLEKQLIEYINSDVYNYAFLIKGEWGAGKSYFIDHFINEYKDKTKMFFKVSLNGLKEIEDVDILLTENILKNFRKHSIKWTEFKKISKQLNIKNIVGLLKKEYAQVALNSALDIATDIINNENCVLVFDDLERCKIEYDEIMSYINLFIEIQKMKVIIIANEDKIKKEAYYKNKEKIIGHAVELIPDIKNGYLSFIAKNKNEKLKNILEVCVDNLVKELAKQNHNNLRTVQFIIENFVNFYNIVLKDSEFVDNLELNITIFNYFVFASVMYKIGKPLYDWNNVEHGYITIEKDNYNPDNFRYGFKFVDYYVYNGILEKEKILDVIKDYDDKTLPKDDPYKVLKNFYWEMEDKEVYEQIDKIEKMLETNKYKTSNVLDVLILLLSLKNNGYDVDICKFIELFKKVIQLDIENDDILFKSEFANFMAATSEVKREYSKIYDDLKEFTLIMKFELINRYVQSGEFKELNNILNTSNIIKNNNFFSNIDLKAFSKGIENAKTTKDVRDSVYFCHSLLEDAIYLSNCDVVKEVESIKNLLELLKEIRIQDNIGKNNAVKNLVECLEKFVKMQSKQEE